MLETPAAACFGKLPARGDFVAIGLPGDFLPAWDGFLQRVVLASQARLGHGWRQAWVEAPVWHFLLGPGLGWATPAAGVLVASVDRVGRYFPFTVLAPARAGGVPLPDWALRAEALALRGLAENLDVLQIHNELNRLAGPEDVNDAPSPPPPGWSALDGTADWPAGVPRLAGILPRHDCLFWCRGSPLLPARMLRAHGLPDDADAASLIAGPADVTPE